MRARKSPAETVQGVAVQAVRGRRLESHQIGSKFRLPDLELERVSCFCTREVGLGDFSG